MGEGLGVGEVAPVTVRRDGREGREYSLSCGLSFQCMV